MQVTELMLKELLTSRGGYSGKQVELAQTLTGKSSWKKALIGSSVTSEWWEIFSRSKCSTKESRLNNKFNNRRKYKSSLIINPMTVITNGWEWKPSATDIPKVKEKTGKLSNNNGKKAINRKKLSSVENTSFYLSREWLSLRVRVLSKYDCKCMMCGRSPREHGIVIHVDHIKPRSKYPELALCFDNLQLLCEDCNIGKSNKYETDYRPDIMPDQDLDLLENMPTTMQ